jgi:hypothetical protein
LPQSAWAQRLTELPFALETLKLDSQALCVGRQAGTSVGAPLLLFNGIGGNIELLAPIARWMPQREVTPSEWAIRHCRPCHISDGHCPLGDAPARPLRTYAGRYPRLKRLV